MEQRPAPSPSKLKNQFDDWLDETELPGRTLAYLKTGFLPEVLAENESDLTVAMLEAWAGWEKGTTEPQVVLESLRDQGLGDFLEELSG